MPHKTPATQQPVRIIFWRAEHRSHPKNEMAWLEEEQRQEIGSIKPTTIKPADFSAAEYYAAQAEAWEQRIYGYGE